MDNGFFPAPSWCTMSYCCALGMFFENLARKRHVSRSAVLREALNGLAGKRKRSAADLAGELVGKLRGTSDLSTSPKHMRGYGE